MLLVCEREKGPLWDTITQSVYLHPAYCIQKESKKKDNLKKSEKERDTEGHHYAVYLLSSCVLNPVIEFENKKMTNKFLNSTPCGLHLKPKQIEKT